MATSISFGWLPATARGIDSPIDPAPVPTADARTNRGPRRRPAPRGSLHVLTTPYAVVISGAPGSGKTSLGWQLSRHLHLPFVSRDDLKTGLHVTHRSTDPNETHRFAETAFDAFFELVGWYLDRGVSVVCEAPFHQDRSGPHLARLAERGDLVHLRVVTPPDVALARYEARAAAGARHPAHADVVVAAEVRRGERDLGVYVIDGPWPTLDVDGRDGWSPSLTDIADFVNRQRSAN